MHFPSFIEMVWMVSFDCSWGFDVVLMQVPTISLILTFLKSTFSICQPSALSMPAFRIFVSEFQFIFYSYFDWISSNKHTPQHYCPYLPIILASITSIFKVTSQLDPWLDSNMHLWCPSLILELTWYFS